MRATVRTLILSSVVLAAVLTTLFWRPSRENELTIFCAAVVLPPLDDIRDAYRKQAGVLCSVSVDGSGALLAKMKASAPADIYIAAERHFAEEAYKPGLIERPEPLVRLEPVIAVAKGNPKKIVSLADLIRNDVRVSLAEPDLAAVGHLTREVMTGLRLWDKFAERAKAGGVAFQGTVTKAAGDVAVGAADASVVWIPAARPFQLDIVHDPALDASAECAFVAITSNSQRPGVAREFIQFLTTSPEARAAFDRLGFPKANSDAHR